MSETRVVVVGAGPAGMAAAFAAAEVGAAVRFLDDNPKPGGQIWRRGVGKKQLPHSARVFTQLYRPGGTFSGETTVFDAPEAGLLMATRRGSAESIHYDRLVIATGARELFLPFPGWTLPGVMGAGGAQALLKCGANFAGKRVIVAGSGPLLLAVGASFAAAGAELVGVYEQASVGALARFGLRAITVDRVKEGLKYFAQLGVAPYSASTWVTEASGGDRLQNVSLTNGARSWTERCDLLACAFGLVPNTELAALVGCRIERGCVAVDENQKTSITSVFAAGEPLGIGGLELALAEGKVAGQAAAGVDDPVSRAEVERLRGFRDVLARGFALRPEVLRLARPETILCRCEDVRMREIDPSWSAREAKLTTRIGMGPCQGRVCGPAARRLFGWESDTVRPPLFPTEVNHLAAQERAEAP